MAGIANTGKGLRTGAINFWRYVAISMSGVFVYGIAVAVAGGYIDYAQNAAIYVGILGLIVVILISVPIMEYTRLVNFAGGYYGLAEIGFGKAVGKYTALLNYAYFTFLQIGNGLLTAELLLVAVYIIYGVLFPVWVVVIIAFITLVVMFLGAIYRVNNLTKMIQISVVIQVAVMLISAIYVILKTPYNSISYFNPLTAPHGFASIGLGAAVSGFLTYEAYGTGLFFSEEGKEAKKAVWRSIIFALIIATLIGVVSIYSELAASHNIAGLASSPIPLVTAYLPYVGGFVALFLVLLFVPFYFSSNVLGTSGAQARLLYSLSRDGFIKSDKLSQLGKQQTPVNAAIVNFILAAIGTIVVMAVVIPVYGYNETTLFYVAFAPYTAATILWYFHHFIPDVSLYFYYRKAKIKVSFIRKLVVGVLTPAFGVGIFVFAFYDGVVSSEVEPYFAFVVVAAIIAIGSAVYVAIKAKLNALGGSFVTERIELENK